MYGNDYNCLHEARKKLFGNFRLSELIFCDQHDPAGILIDPVHQIWFGVGIPRIVLLHMV